MVSILLSNLELVAILIVFVFLAFLANIFLGIAVSTSIEHNFNWKKLRHGLIKGILIIIAVFSLTTVVSLFLPVLELYDIMIIEEGLMNSINILTIVGPIVTATFAYAKDACAKVKELFAKDKKEIQIKFNEYVD